MPSPAHMMLIYHSMPIAESGVHARADNARYNLDAARRDMTALRNANPEVRGPAAAREADAYRHSEGATQALHDLLDEEFARRNAHE